ncbi:MAG: type II toxin-antitoxin system RelE/ParE family toxin [Candidatus Nanohalobium sp.]
MDYSFKATAKQSLEELDKGQAEEIIKLIEEVAEQGFNHDKVKMIKDRNGDWVYRIKAAEDNTNHRVFIDYIEGELKIIDILHRNIAYDGKYGNG